MGKGKGTWASKGVSPWQMVAHLQLRYQGLLTEQWSLRCYSATLRLLLSRNVALILLALKNFWGARLIYVYDLLFKCLQPNSITNKSKASGPDWISVANKFETFALRFQHNLLLIQATPRFVLLHHSWLVWTWSQGLADLCFPRFNFHIAIFSKCVLSEWVFTAFIISSLMLPRVHWKSNLKQNKASQFWEAYILSCRAS